MMTGEINKYYLLIVNISAAKNLNYYSIKIQGKYLLSKEYITSFPDMMNEDQYFALSFDWNSIEGFQYSSKRNV